MNNLKELRELCSISRKEIALLLNVSVHLYHFYETNRIPIPKEIRIMLGRLYGISPSELVCEGELISTETRKQLQQYANLDDVAKMQILSMNLSQGKYSRLNFAKVEEIKREIIEEKCDIY